MKTIEWVSRIQDILLELPELDVLDLGYNKLTGVARIQIGKKEQVYKLGKVRTQLNKGENHHYTKHYTYVDGVEILYAEVVYENDNR